MVYERYAVPGPDHVLFQGSLANFNPHAPTTVNFHNDTRAPLLLIAGGRDHVVPASVTRANFKLYGKSKAITALKEYPRALALHAWAAGVGRRGRLRAGLGRPACINLRRSACAENATDALGQSDTEVRADLR